ncbi:profilin-like protein [Yokapox virus]|uniref:Profilin n=1 Tax=Yokapox virus TaxID=1076255 RepID=G3EI37_9POXV|nr:profilin-like protein [Yokapox virus]AEN03734.1 profilin-like protein [Yokapox virus]
MVEWNKFIDSVAKDDKFQDAAIIDYKYKKNIIVAIPNKSFSKILPGEVNILMLYKNNNSPKVRLGKINAIIYTNNLTDENIYTMELLNISCDVSPIAVCKTHTALVFLMGKPTTSRKDVYDTCRRFAEEVRKTGN